MPLARRKTKQLAAHEADARAAADASLDERDSEQENRRAPYTPLARRAGGAPYTPLARRADNEPHAGSGGPRTRRWHVPSTGAHSTACPAIRRRRRDRSTFMRAYQTLISPTGGAVVERPLESPGTLIVISDMYTK